MKHRWSSATECHIPEDGNIYGHYRENLKSNIILHTLASLQQIVSTQKGTSHDRTTKMDDHVAYCFLKLLKYDLKLLLLCWVGKQEKYSLALMIAQFSSSEPSTQSLTPLHLHIDGMQ